MKILHFADLHIGIESYGRINPETGLSTRLEDILKALDYVVDYAINNQIDLILFCGDAYKSRDPSQTHQREFARRLKTLSQANIPVFLLVGNHDLPNAIGRATAVEIFRTLAVDNIYIGSDFDIYHISTKSGLVQILALPWLKKSVLLTRDNLKNLTIEQINEKLQEIMTDRILSLASKLKSDIPSILAAHVSVSSAKPGSEKNMLVGREPVLLLSNIAQNVFDYIALGHIHRAQILSENPPVIYSGSLERLDFSDENIDKGFYVIEIDNARGEKKVIYEFHKINARQFISLNVDINTNDSDPTPTVLKSITTANIKDAIVRLQISLPKNMESFVKEADIHKSLKEAYYYTIGKRFIQEENIRPGSIINIEELTPLEALKIYFESKKMEGNRIKILLEHGEKIIRETTGEY